MASILKVDTITGVATAGSIAITGEGNSTTTNLQQGLAKSWINVKGTGTASSDMIRDSFNISSDTDNGTGNYTFAFSSNMNNDDYAAGSGVSGSTDAGNFNPAGICNRTTSNYVMDIENASSVGTDPGIGDATIFGDLA
tara:strand:- start:4796 stop:5212 length:417 start_codon:yes stop_codon:yes gene_type:complete